MPYKRIQNVDISKGLLDRLFKLSNLRIQTTAGVSRYGTIYEGSLSGLSVQTAKDLQAELVKRASL
ncbi:MAG: PH domain-containing protein [Oligoflexia bacterium]|nr:PH domain-containing protein [Oligoflexia bacterium]